VSQIPRLLTRMDRIEISRTYGCMDRLYWLDRAADFPSSIAQFGVHALALVYAHPYPDNPYHRHPKMLEWVWAGVDYWTRIQKSDGSFDEFYPNERGWAGPTGFLLYVMLDTYRTLKDEIPADLENRLLEAAHRAGRYLADWDERGTLANHHAMSLLPLYEAFLVTDDPHLERQFERQLAHFLTLCHDEGWCLEYDGVDPGYLSATVSFLAKLYKVFPDERLFNVAQKAVEFSSYFVYPNGYYAGTIGSRQTLHFYPHGYEYFADRIPLAGAVAEKMLVALDEGKLVPPEIMSERYHVYRVPELLLSWLDYQPHAADLPPVPYECESFRVWFPGAKIHAEKTAQHYVVTNLAKGGVVKGFALDSARLTVNDVGIIGELSNGKAVSTVWIGDEYEVSVADDDRKLAVEGHFYYVASTLMSPWKFIAFRLVMLLLGWQTRIAYELKGFIRRLAITSSKQTPVRFRREISQEDGVLHVADTITLGGGLTFRRLKFGDEFPVRYVPQSRYFQGQELDVTGHWLPDEALSELNRIGTLTISRRYDLSSGETRFG
jgi:hypothetical protein